MPLSPRPLLVAGLLPALAALAACGGADDDSGTGAAPSSAPSTVSTPSPTPSGLSSQEAQSIGIEAQGVGLDVAQWSVKNDFKIPADQAAFEKDIVITTPLSSGSKAGYERKGKTFQVCVTQYAGSEPAGWGIYDSVSGGNTSGVGAPTEDFCP